VTDYVKCEECGAPLDEKQRYCVSCGARRRDTSGPAVRYFATAGRRTRRGSRRAGAPSGARAAAVLFFVVLPIAVAIGVLVGKGDGGGNNDQELAAALRGLQASGGSNAALASSVAATPITSDFTLDKGYTVELKTLPVDGTDQAAIDAAKKDATSKGAADVGIINTSEFTVAPAPPANTYVLYSGQFKSKGEATKALGKLKAKFADAEVVSVKRNSGSGEGQLVSKTAYGDVHKVEGFAPSPEKVASDTALVNKEGQRTGKDYVDSQKDLPDVIVVGGSGGGASNPASQGNGD
jgi:hypothetical protein